MVLMRGLNGAARERESVLCGVNGAWLPWVVGKQSLSLAASVLVPVWPSQEGLLAPAAVGLWSVGLMLYLLLVALILLRWLSVAMSPATLGPPYWILMGATAITVLAGARILNLPAALPVTRATAGLVEGFSFALWAFCAFPLGMYSVATLLFGKVAHLHFMAPFSRFMLWVAVAAWVVVAVASVVEGTGLVLVDFWAGWCGRSPSPSPSPSVVIPTAGPLGGAVSAVNGMPGVN